MRQLEAARRPNARAADVGPHPRLGGAVRSRARARRPPEPAGQLWGWYGVAPGLLCNRGEEEAHRPSRDKLARRRRFTPKGPVGWLNLGSPPPRKAANKGLKRYAGAGVSFGQTRSHRPSVEHPQPSPSTHRRSGARAARQKAPQSRRRVALRASTHHRGVAKTCTGGCQRGVCYGIRVWQKGGIAR